MLNKTIKQRQSGIELLRIIAIIMIISSHLSVHGIIKNNLLILGNQGNRIFSSFLVLGNVGVGLFFLITGYFSKNGQRKKVNKNLIADIIFYSLFTALILLIASSSSELRNLFGIESFSGLVKSVIHLLITPITGENWWFVTSYVYLILFIAPVLDAIESRMSTLGWLVLIACIFFSVVVSEYLETPVMRLLQASGYYLVGKFVRYIKTNYKPDKGCVKRYFLTLCMLLLHLLLTYVSYNISSGILYLISNLLITILVCPLLVVFIFLIFSDENSTLGGMKSRYINLLSETTLGIYLLHDSVYVRKLLWNYFIPMEKLYASNLFALYAIAIVVCIFLITAVISLIYIHFLRSYLLRLMEFFKNRILYLLGMED